MGGGACLSRLSSDTRPAAEHEAVVGAFVKRMAGFLGLVCESRNSPRSARGGVRTMGFGQLQQCNANSSENLKAATLAILHSSPMAPVLRARRTQIKEPRYARHAS